MEARRALGTAEGEGEKGAFSQLAGIGGLAGPRGEPGGHTWDVLLGPAQRCL